MVGLSRSQCVINKQLCLIRLVAEMLILQHALMHWGTVSFFLNRQTGLRKHNYVFTFYIIVPHLNLVIIVIYSQRRHDSPPTKAFIF